MAIKKIFLFAFLITSCLQSTTISANNIDAHVLSSHQTEQSSIEATPAITLFSSHEFNEELLDIGLDQPTTWQLVKNWVLMRLIRFVIFANNGYNYVKNQSARTAAFLNSYLKRVAKLRRSYGK